MIYAAQTRAQVLDTGANLCVRLPSRKNLRHGDFIQRLDIGTGNRNTTPSVGPVCAGLGDIQILAALPMTVLLPIERPIPKYPQSF